MMKWFFLAKRPDRPAMGDAFRNTFEGEQVPRSIARETIQNSVDAVAPSEVPSVRYTLLDDIDLSPLLSEEFLPHAEASGVPALAGAPRVRALYVEDYGTVGLTGSMRNLESRFYRLMGQLGGGDTGGGRGGSYGYGKAACILASGCRSVIAYTVTDKGSALFGTCYLDPYVVHGKRYTGLGWYAHKDSSEEAPAELCDDEADALASRLGFPRAGTGECGTSLLIPCAQLNLDELRREIELAWWPRLIDHNLSVIIVSNNGTTSPNPARNRDLVDFIELYEATQKRSGVASSDRLVPIKRQSASVGTLAMRFRADYSLSDDDAAPLGGSIALMRDQRMVVSYYRWNQGPRGDLVGVFVADPSINNDLRMTEDLKHSTWSSDTTRASAQQCALAKHINDSVRRQYRAYLREFTPPAIRDDESLSDLRRFFGSLFSTRGTTGGAAKAAPIEILERRATVVPDSKGLHLEGSARIRYKGKDPAELRIGVSANLAESDASNTGDSIELSLATTDHQLSGHSPSFRRAMKSGDSVMMSFRTESYESDWTAVATFFAEVIGNA